MTDHDHGHGHGDDHDHDHDHDRGLIDRLRHLFGHDHPSGAAPLADTGAAGVRASQVSLAGLGVTAVLQAVVVVFTGSVALLSDTLHNLTDALTAIPLWIAFSLGRRGTSRKYTFGLGRAEDLAGMVIVLAIAVSAGGVAWESIRRLADPRPLEFAGWVVVAGIIGALGNELVAHYRIRVGRRISSEALIADGHHARADALTSLAVVAAGIGAMAGLDWVDPVAGLVVAFMILAMLKNAATRVFGRFLDGVDPDLVDRIEHTVGHVAGVAAVGPVQARWHGHRLLITLTISVDPDLTVRAGHAIALEVCHALMHTFPFADEPVIHVEPGGHDDAHELTEHHRRTVG